jgi:quercetin dioxygenase-like cupin family protein
MQAIHAENVSWKAQARGVREAKIYSAIHGTEETRIDMVEVPAGSYIPPHRHSARTEFITILASAGAQLQIGERIFRPIAGQVFHREPGDILALTNDSQHLFSYSVVRFGYEASDVEHLSQVDEETEQAADEPAEDEAPEEKAETEAAEVDESEDAEPAVEEEPEAREEPEDEKAADTDDQESAKEDTAEAEEPKKPEKPKKTKKPKKSKKSKDKNKGDSSDEKSSKKSKKKPSKSSKKKK